MVLKTEIFYTITFSKRKFDRIDLINEIILKLYFLLDNWQCLNLSRVTGGGTIPDHDLIDKISSSQDLKLKFLDILDVGDQIEVISFQIKNM